MGVVDKITKLLALASEEGGGTEAERNLAAERAQEMMLKHRVDQAAIEQARGREALPGIERERLGKVNQSRFWYVQLLEVIADEVQVDVIWVGSLGSKRVSLVGRPDSIAYTRKLAEWLAPQLESECAAALIEEKAHSDEWALAWSPGEAAARTMEFRRSFYEAAVRRIGHRLSMARRAAGVKGTALVRSDKAAIEEFYGDLKPKEVSREDYYGMGSDSGREAGDRADISPGTKVGGADRKEIGG